MLGCFHHLQLLSPLSSPQWVVKKVSTTGNSMPFDSGWWTTLPKTNILHLENWWETFFFFWGGKRLIFAGANHVRFREGIWFVQSQPDVLFYFFPCFLLVGDLLATWAGLFYGLECRSSFSHLVGSLDCKTWKRSDDPPSMVICDHNFRMWTPVITRRQAKS